MLGLPQQVHRAHLGIGRVVGNHQRLGRTGKQVDADAAIQLALGFGHVHVARTDQHVDWRDGRCAHGHRHHGLNAAQHQDLVGAGHRHGCHDGGMRRALVRRRRGDDALHARHLGREYAHVGRGQQRVLAARDVAAHGVDRDVFVAEHHAGIGFNLDVLHRVALDLREVAHLLLRERDVLDLAWRQALAGLLDVGDGQAEVGWVPLVELAAELAHRVVAAQFDCLDDVLDGRAHLGVIVGAHLNVFAAFEVIDHDVTRVG